MPSRPPRPSQSPSPSSSHLPADAPPATHLRDPRVDQGTHLTTTNTSSAIPATVATPPSSFRYPPRLTRGQSRSIRPTTPERPPPGGGSSSSLETSASSALNRSRSRGPSHGSISELFSTGVSLSRTSTRRNVQRYASHHPGQERNPQFAGEEDPDGDDDEPDPHPRGAHTSGGASDADSERSTGRPPQDSRLQPVGGGSSEGMLVPMGETFHVKKKRTRVLPTAHQSAELNKLLSETPFPSTARREELGKRIGLSARKVQNRRQKARRNNDESKLKMQASSSADPSVKQDSPGLSPTSPQYAPGAASMAHPPSSWGLGVPPGGPTHRSLPTRPLVPVMSPTAAPYHLPPFDPSQPQPGPSYATDVAAVSSSSFSSRETLPGVRGTDAYWHDPREPGSGSTLPIRRPRSRTGHERIVSLDSSIHLDTRHQLPAPPSSFHPYSPRSRRRESPSRRHSGSTQSLHSSPARARRDLPTESPRSVSGPTYSYDLPPLNLQPELDPPPPPTSLLPRRPTHMPQSSIERLHAEDRGPLSPRYPPRESLAGLASTNLSSRLGEASQDVISPTTPGPPLHAPAYPPPFTLQPEPLWDRADVPEYLQLRRLSWHSPFGLRRSSSTSAAPREYVGTVSGGSTSSSNTMARAPPSSWIPRARREAERAVSVDYGDRRPPDTRPPTPGTRP
ncbi:hypothetical protein FRB99_005599 [Tulasnella sp. 403]|nr:hypothetical protein FRB99_005599 [Tulasnella sp. 403]